ncbi:MAG: hypothetical protein KAI66_24830 [Lentisphaeria bacterium]|nr:hypothetical protein [Lentisphaeria bacterium]
MNIRLHRWLWLQVFLTVGLALLFGSLAHRVFVVLDQVSETKSLTLLRAVASAIQGAMRHGPDQHGRVYGILEEVARDPDVLSVDILNADGRPLISIGHSQPSPPGTPQVNRFENSSTPLVVTMSFEIQAGCMAPGECQCSSGACHCAPHLNWTVPPGNYQLALVMNRGTADRVMLPVLGVTLLGLLILVALLAMSVLLARSLTARESLDRDVAMEQERRLRVESLSLAAAGLAHEIRNPLAAIRGYAQMLHESAPEGEPQERSSLMLNELDRVAERLEEFLGFARKREPRSEPVDLIALAKKVSALLMQDLESAQIELQIVEAKPPVSVLGDAGQLQELLLNLVLNSVDSCKPGGRISVSLSRLDSGLELEVRDDGQGIDPKDLPQLFDPYFTTKERGSGLGLSISRRVAEDHGAKLTLANGPEAGVVARLHFPKTRVVP